MLKTWIQDIREHKWLALRALVIGWGSLLALWVLVVQVVNLDDWLFVRGFADIHSWWPDPRKPFFHFLIGGCVFALAGWLVGRFDKAHRLLVVLLFFLSVLAISDLPQFIPAAIKAWPPGYDIRFWETVTLDFIFTRLPIIAAGIWGVRD